MNSFFSGLVAYIKAHIAISVITGTVVVASVVTPIVIVNNSKTKKVDNKKDIITENNSTSQNSKIEQQKEVSNKETIDDVDTDLNNNEVIDETKTEIISKKEDKIVSKNEQKTSKKEQKNNQVKEVDNDYSNAKGSISPCEYDPNGEECKFEKMSSHFTYNIDNESVYYDNNFLFGYEFVNLERCYDSYSCVMPWSVKIYNYNENLINNLSKDAKDFLRDNYSFVLGINDVQNIQRIYNDVIAHDYINICTNELNDFNSLINTYSQYKDELYFPEELNVCAQNGQCYNSYSNLISERDWLIEALAKSKSDLTKATNSLNSTNALYNILY